MVQLAHSGSNEEKIQEILAVAQKRFGLFGYSKTAMQEIADELGISKASLYYYFPDKDSLFREVFKKEKQEFIDKLQHAIENSNDAITLLQEFTVMRMTNFKSFFNLSRAGFDEFKGIKNVVKDLWYNFLEKEKIEIIRMFELGEKQGIFKIENKEELAELLLNSLRGISHMYLIHRDFIYVEEAAYEQLIKRLKLFTSIFIKGISV